MHALATDFVRDSSYFCVNHAHFCVNGNTGYESVNRISPLGCAVKVNVMHQTFFFQAHSPPTARILKSHRFRLPGNLDTSVRREIFILFWF